MKLYIYRGLDNEEVPTDVTHVIVDDSVTTIKGRAFFECEHLVSVIMGDNVERIGHWAFCGCLAFRFIRLSKTLEYIGDGAFNGCESVEALFLPSTLKSIGSWAFNWCRSLRLLILPNGIDLGNGRNEIINHAGIYQIAENVGVVYEVGEYGQTSDDSNRRVHEWLFHHMDESPLHKLCYASFITTKQINDYIDENGKDSALQIDAIHGMTPLHMLSMNPHAPADAIASLLNSNMQAVFCADNQQKNPLQYARDYNIGGLVEMINSLCSHRNSSIVGVEADASIENSTSSSKRRKLED